MGREYIYEYPSRCTKYDLYTLGAMALKEDLVRMLMLEIGCNNKGYRTGVTLIEILVVLIIIGITSTLITLNFSTFDLIEKKANSFQKTVSYLTEESIITGKIIGLYLSSDNQFAKYLTEENQNEIDSSYKNTIWSDVFTKENI